MNGQSPTERGCLKDFVASMLGRGSISFWGREDLNAAFLHFGDVFTKLLLIGSILPIIWRTSYLPKKREMPLPAIGISLFVSRNRLVVHPSENKG